MNDEQIIKFELKIARLLADRARENMDSPDLNDLSVAKKALDGIQAIATGRKFSALAPQKAAEMRNFVSRHRFGVKARLDALRDAKQPQLFGFPVDRKGQEREL